MSVSCIPVITRSETNLAHMLPVFTVLALSCSKVTVLAILLRRHVKSFHIYHEVLPEMKPIMPTLLSILLGCIIASRSAFRNHRKGAG